LSLKKINKGRYKIIEKIGKGGQATVAKAEDRTQPGRFVALKIIYFHNRQIEDIYDDNSYQRFHWEFLLTKRLKHPQISTADDYGIDMDNNVIFMARPYLEGHTLTELLNKEGKFSPAEAARIILSIARVLDYIHERDVVHCDLKPSNVIMEYNDPVLIDFGLATKTGECETAFGSSSGTLDYIAPELLDKNTFRKYMNHPSRDWWALGCIAFNLFTGKRIFKESSSNILAAGIHRGREQKVIGKVLSGHKGLAMVKALLERDPEKRVSSKADLENLVEL